VAPRRSNPPHANLAIPVPLRYDGGLDAPVPTVPACRVPTREGAESMVARVKHPQPHYAG